MKMFFTLLCSALLCAGCNDAADSPRGFSLPEGDVKAGKNVFLNYQCSNCHLVKDITLPENHKFLLSEPIRLGSTSTRVITYGELVTSIINPSHRISPRYPGSLTTRDGISKMPSINDELTVSELVDLTAYLETQYQLAPYRTTNYRLYELRIPEPNSSNGEPQ